MASNTALSYQMMIEEKLLSAMVNQQQQGQFAFACSYGNSYLKFLDVDKTKIPKIPVLLQTEGEKQFAYITQYFSILDLITETASDKIKEVRKKYNKKSNEDLLT